jgi:hypothetical protein
VLRGESLRSIAMDWNERGVKTVGGGMWQGSMIRRVLMSPRIAGLKDHRGEIVGEATWPAIIDRATHDRQLVQSIIDETNPPDVCHKLILLVRSVLPMIMCFIPSFMLLGIVPAIVSAVFNAFA